MSVTLPATDGRGIRGYAICTSGRSGSTLLCQYLSSTDQLGRPLEYFNAAGRRAIEDPSYPDDAEQQIERILTQGATANGVYGVKLFPAQAAALPPSLDWTLRLPDLRFVLLKRTDVLGQAISLLRATQTNQWRASLPAQGVAAYDGGRIRDHLRAVKRDYEHWRQFFARKGVEPVVITYEDFIADPQATVNRVAGLFGLQGRASVKLKAVDLTIQRDALTEDWRARFRRDFGYRDEPELAGFAKAPGSSSP